jgi:hypothetical protein
MPNIDKLDFQDSEVSSAKLQDEKFIVRFSAAHIHRADNQHEGIGFLQALELVIDHPTNLHVDEGCVGRIARGSINTGDGNLKSISIPYHANTRIELELEFANGSMCKVLGKGVMLKPTAESHVVEWLKC